MKCWHFLGRLSLSPALFLLFLTSPQPSRFWYLYIIRVYFEGYLRRGHDGVDTLAHPGGRRALSSGLPPVPAAQKVRSSGRVLGVKCGGSRLGKCEAPLTYNALFHL